MPHSPLHRGLTSLFATLVAAVTLSSVAQATHAPTRSPEASQLRALGAPERDAESFSVVTMNAGVQRQYGLDSGVLRRMWLRDPKQQVASNQPARTIAEAFVQAHAAELGLGATYAQQIELRYEKPSPSGTHFRWDQVVDGVKVYRSELVVKVSPKG
ncbi:MAG: hypothetical protein IPJ04_06310 [Candidatus Eisenbacteria bacterium]|nr:hypothetical protein [Candidatus Eisenbacteria bacterium]